MEKLKIKSNLFFFLIFLPFSSSVYLKTRWGQISSDGWEHWVLEEYGILTISTTKCELLSVRRANPAEVSWQICLSSPAILKSSISCFAITTKSRKALEQLGAAPQHSTNLQFSSAGRLAQAGEGWCGLWCTLHVQKVCTPCPQVVTNHGRVDATSMGRTTSMQHHLAGVPEFKRIWSPMQTGLPSPPGQKCL